MSKPDMQQNSRQAADKDETYNPSFKILSQYTQHRSDKQVGQVEGLVVPYS